MKKVHEHPFYFDFLFYKEGESVIAHCLQTDTAAFGDTVEQAKNALRSALECEIDEALQDEDLSRIFDTPAPDELWARISKAVEQTCVLELWEITATPQGVSQKTPVRRIDFMMAGATA